MSIKLSAWDTNSRVVSSSWAFLRLTCRIIWLVLRFAGGRLKATWTGLSTGVSRTSAWIASTWIAWVSLQSRSPEYSHPWIEPSHYECLSCEHRLLIQHLSLHQTLSTCGFLYLVAFWRENSRSAVLASFGRCKILKVSQKFDSDVIAL